jgi:hypothetical protein
MSWRDRPGGRLGRTGLASAGATAGLLAALVFVSDALAASPAPTGATGGDPRSSGQGPGLVGDPLLAIAIVAAVGLLAVAATLLYVRLTDGRHGA